MYQSPSTWLSARHHVIAVVAGYAVLKSCNQACPDPTIYHAAGSRRTGSATGSTRARREIRAPHLADAARLEPALDDLVAEQREDAAAKEERPRVAVPVDAGGA